MTEAKIGLIGKFRVGKDSVAAYASTFYDFATYAFGDELKRDYHAKNPEVPRTPKPRAGYQSHGQAERLLRGVDVWVDEVFRTIESHRWPERIMITDVRQSNEVARLKAEGFVLIRITAPDHVRIERAKAAGDSFSAEDLAHSTELAVDDFEVDYEIVNYGSLVELYEKFDRIAAELGVTKKRLAQ